jgi:hypothetical protein
MKKVLLVLICFFAILIPIIFLYTISQHEQENQEKKEILLRIENIKDPKQIFWYEDNLYIVHNGKIKKFNLEKRETKFFSTIDENQILAKYFGKLVYIEYQNRIIENPREYATQISIFDLKKRESFFSQEYHETIKPIYIEDNFLFLIDNYFNSPGRTYRIDLESGNIERYNFEEPKIEGTESVRIFTEDRIFDIPLINMIRHISIDESKKRVALIDTRGYVWIYLED